jgi:acetylornithine deacetylase
MEVAQPDLAVTPGAGKDDRFNVYAAPPGITPDVVLSTHMDTVPPFFPCTEDDEFLYGRGSCDAKGIIAAQVAAAERLRDAGVKAGLLFVVGEERDSAGAKVANRNPRGSRFLINGEPTDNRLALATKGALRVELRAKGRMAHSAYPELGDSAIHKLVEALHDVLAMPLPIEPEIGPTTLNIGLINGGYAPNVIADKACIAQFSSRFRPASRPSCSRSTTSPSPSSRSSSRRTSRSASWRCRSPSSSPSAAQGPARHRHRARRRAERRAR